MERSTFSDIFHTAHAKKPLNDRSERRIDNFERRVLNVTPLPVRKNTLRFPGESPSTTPKSFSFSPTPNSFSDIFQPRPPADQTPPNKLIGKTTERIEKGTTKATALATLRAILEHVKKKEDEFEGVSSTTAPEYDYEYEYVYEYVDVDEEPINKQQLISNIEKPRPKIVPKQRVPASSKLEKSTFSSFVTRKPQVQSKPITKYNSQSDTIDIIYPPLVIETNQEQDQTSTRRSGYNYEEPEGNKLDLPSDLENTIEGSLVDFESAPPTQTNTDTDKKSVSYVKLRIPGRLSQQSSTNTNYGSQSNKPPTSYNRPVQNTFFPSDLSAQFPQGSSYFDKPPREPLSPSLQYERPPTQTASPPSSYVMMVMPGHPTKAKPHGAKRPGQGSGYSYKAPDGPRLKYGDKQVGIVYVCNRGKLQVR